MNKIFKNACRYVKNTNGGVAALLFVGAVVGAMQWGAYQQQECSSGWYWIGYNVGVGKEIENGL